jgi:hypothetical protein
VRWRQSKLGLCRRCEKELGIEAEGQLEREKERVEKQAQRVRKTQAGYLHPHQRAEHARFARRPRRIALQPCLLTHARRDLEYVVVWSGDMDGAEAMGLPLGNDKRSSWSGITRDRFQGERKGGGLRHPGAFDGDARD